MSKPKKEPKVYTIKESIWVEYQIVAMSAEDAEEAYRTMPNDKWNELVAEAASNNYCDDEVDEDEAEEYDHQSEAGNYPITDKAKKYINKNLPEA